MKQSGTHDTAAPVGCHNKQIARWAPSDTQTQSIDPTVMQLAHTHTNYRSHIYAASTHTDTQNQSVTHQCTHARTHALTGDIEHLPADLAGALDARDLPGVVHATRNMTPSCFFGGRAGEFDSVKCIC